MKKLKPCFIQFNKNRTIKAKEYLFDYAIKSANCQPVIIIIYNKSTFSINNDI